MISPLGVSRILSGVPVGSVTAQRLWAKAGAVDEAAGERNGQQAEASGGHEQIPLIVSRHAPRRDTPLQWRRSEPVFGAARQDYFHS
jgi:hypothetical protein